ncbi:acetylornithine deacetylase [Nitrosococcus watsonii]|uniref:Probable succinyl-diaminopimelate desuccinylase n=1 Tax=Nitrosococcus watsoni (strain C-113) TaxID=105559 RepID=D8KAG1_NITWC|nr:acetylornithine deacetylase [Nitrosococcus watsonii]ADJ27476.1 acetylornithine deacetylase (ArgE) [Nitrosococcus watsonii C-113]
MENNEAPYLPILEKLIRFPTISRETNLPLIEYSEDFLNSRGFQTQRFYNKQRNKANLMARIGPDKKGGLMLAGHTDVVPVDQQAWTNDPFRLVEKNGCLYGRGTSDMKGFLALALEIAASIEGHRLQCPLYLCFTYDEEIGCGGAKALIGYLKTLSPPPRFVLIGEPTDMELVTAHKSIQITTTHIRGKPAHSSCPQLGASAIVFASKLIAALEEILPPEENRDFNPPAATFNVGAIQGGTAINIIPEHCQFDWECRTLPSQNPAQLNEAWERLIHALRKQIPGIEVENHIKTAVPGLKAESNREIATWLKEFLEEGKIGTAPFMTEAGLYQQAGLPTVVCGPGSIQEAHQPDENISIHSMENYRFFLYKIVGSLMEQE